jgi:hypothetical protein
MEDQTNPTALYTLTEEGGLFIIRRPDGEVIFRLKPRHRDMAHELLANLNRMVAQDVQRT